MKARRLFTQEDGGYAAAGVWYCGKCGGVHKTEALASSCCACPSCQHPSERGGAYCEACSLGRAWEWEKSRWAKAEAVQEANWKGAGMLEWNDHYFDWVHELEEYAYEDGMDSLPDEVWIAPGRRIVELPDTRGLLERLCDDQAYEDWEWDGAGQEDLNQAITKFNRLNDGPRNLVYSPDYRRKLVLDPQRVRRFREEWEAENDEKTMETSVDTN